MLILTPWLAMADGRVLHIGNTAINLVQSCNSDHSLNLKIGNETWCTELTTELADNAVHVRFDNVTYTVCDGTCGGSSGGGEEYVMPEVPPEPEQLPSSCTWTQTNSNAYLLSDGNQYFDTKVPVDTTMKLETTVQIINGTSTRLMGAVSSSCHYDISIRNDGRMLIRMGSSNSGTPVNLDESVRKAKNTWSIYYSGNRRYIYLNGSQLQTTVPYNCSGTSTIKILTNDYLGSTVIDPTLSGGIKLYNIKLYNSSGGLIHNYQPVVAGTNICGYTVPTNAMWDTVSKQVYLPAGTGQMGYGIDP